MLRSKHSSKIYIKKTKKTKLFSQFSVLMQLWIVDKAIDTKFSQTINKSFYPAENRVAMFFRGLYNTKKVHQNCLFFSSLVAKIPKYQCDKFQSSSFTRGLNINLNLACQLPRKRGFCPDHRGCVFNLPTNNIKFSRSHSCKLVVLS